VIIKWSSNPYDHQIIKSYASFQSINHQMIIKSYSLHFIYLHI
jgi:hypothetical protein